MKHTFKYIVLSLSLILLFPLNSQAQEQKLAHLDIDTVAFQMPEYQRAKSELEDYAQQVHNRLKAEEDKLKAFYEKVSKEAQNLSQVELKKREEQLMKMQQDLEKMAVDADNDLAKKEMELTKVVYERIDRALGKVAREKGYNYVFDKKMFLFSDAGDDITEFVLSELQKGN